MAEQLDQQLPATRNLHESLSRAEELATRRKHSVVGLDHLLLALGQDPEAVAVLLVCKVDVEALCMDLLRKLGPEARMRSPNTVPPSFDVTVQNLIAHASAAALQAGYTEIDGSNILSAIISGEGGMITHKILQKHGLTFNETVLNLENKKQNKDEKQAGLEPKSEQQEQPNQAEGQPDHEQNVNYKLVPEVEGKKSVRDQGPEKRTEQTAADKAKEPLVNEASIDGQNTKEFGEKRNQGSLDSIVQAEARPEDYGMSVEGNEYHPVPPKVDPALLKGNKGLNQAPSNPHQHAQNVAVKNGPMKEQMPSGHPLTAQGQQQSQRQPGNVPPHQMNKGMPAPVNKSSAQSIRAPQQHIANEQDPLPSILNNQGPQGLRAENQDPRNKVQRNQTQNDLRQESPTPDEQGVFPQAKGRKVSFNKAEFGQPLAGKEPAVGEEHLDLQEQKVAPQSQPQDKFIKEDKYGNTPPKLPVPPHPGSVQRDVSRDDPPHVDLSENVSPAPKGEGKEEVPLRSGQKAMPPHFPQMPEPKLNEQGAINRGLMEQGSIDQAPLNLPPVAREGIPHAQGYPVPGQLGQGLKGKEQLGQGQQGQQFPANNIASPQQRQQPARPGQPPYSHSQAQNGQLQHEQTQEKMDGIANSIAQNQKNKELLGGQDQVVENIPKVMRVGKVHYLEVRVAKFANTEIELSPEDYGLRSKQNSNPLTKAITVRLTGPDGLFLIDCATSSTQWTEMQGGITNDADFAVWRWRVLPRKSGVSKLRLDITARTSNEDGLTAEIPIQPSKSIDIKVTRNYGSIFKKLIIIGGIFAVGFGVAQYGERAYKLVQEQVKEFSRKD